MNLGTAVVLAVIIIILAAALRSSLHHFKGEGGCCGGTVKAEHKKLEGPKTGEMIVHIEGMHCDNCRYRAEHYINQIEGASAKVSLRKKTAVVSLDREVSEDEIVRAVEKADLEVSGISRRQM